MKREIKIGIFTVAMIVVAWGGVRFLSGIDLFSSNTDYYAHYTEINGVQNASPIFVKGVKVGTVTNIALENSADADVVLTLTINNKFDIPKDSEAKIFTNGLMGGKAIDLVLGRSKEYIQAGEIIPSTCDVDLLGRAESEIEYLKGRVDAVTIELTTTLSNLNRLIEGNTENLSKTIANMSELSGNLSSLLKHNDKELTAIVDGFAQFSTTLGGNSAEIESIINNINILTADLSEAQLGESINSSLSQIDQLMSQLNSSDGNVGKILRDEAMYDNLVSASANLDSLIYDVKQNPKRYVNISVFGGSDESRAQARAAKIARKDAAKRAKAAELQTKR